MDLFFWKKITPRKLNKILDAHQVWFSSRQKEGTRANLSEANLREIDLEDATLMEDQLITAVMDENTILPDGSNG